jgi:threonine dehydrogenase-like Zn-dependent dehydrogenase
MRCVLSLESPFGAREPQARAPQFINNYRGEQMMAMAQVIHEKGGPANFVWEEVDVGPPGPAEVRIRNLAIGVNFTDTYHRRGTPHPLVVGEPPVILGLEAVGTVSTEDKARIARDLRCHHTINYSTEDSVERVLDLTKGEGVHVVYESIEKAPLRQSLQCPRVRGMCAAYGPASGVPEPAGIVEELGVPGSLFITRPAIWHYLTPRSAMLTSAGRLTAGLNPLGQVLHHESFGGAVVVQQMYDEIAPRWAPLPLTTKVHDSLL